jgi:hypothetical protein|tara:strand:+ start:87 stop:461 length:375 start_codon:yes stop_codon:yes gene_type:complete
MFVKPYAKGQRPYDLRMIEDIATTLGSMKEATVWTATVRGQNSLHHNGIIYHAKLNPDKDTWGITCLGTECIDAPYKDKYYDGMENLPTELREKIVVLSILEPLQPQVEGVGYRISSNSFWVFC